jgi:glycosyltransferase involved in cell wall biosynthesis
VAAFTRRDQLTLALWEQAASSTNTKPPSEVAMSIFLPTGAGFCPSQSILSPARLAFVTSTPLSITGGSGTYVGIKGLARALETQNVRIEMHAPDWGFPGYTARRILFNLMVAPTLRTGHADWVVGFDLDGFHYGRKKTVPYVASIKGVIADELRNERGIVQGVLRIQAACERLAVRRADVVVSTSRYSRARIVEAYGVPIAKVVIVPELIDLQAWETETRLQGETEADPPAILTVAHMYPRKNLGLLLKALARLRDAGVAFQGWIVGDGPSRQAWERLRDSLGLQDCVTFLGTLSRRQLVDRYRRAAIFCLPSRQEGFGIVFLEAMACGKPIVAARAAAVPETVIDGECGLLLDPDDPEALARALTALLRDPDLRQEMGEAGRRRVKQYGADRVAAYFLETVQSTLQGGMGREDRVDRHAGPFPVPGGHRVARTVMGDAE